MVEVRKGVRGDANGNETKLRMRKLKKTKGAEGKRGQVFSCKVTKVSLAKRAFKKKKGDEVSDQLKGQ